MSFLPSSISTFTIISSNQIIGAANNLKGKIVFSRDRFINTPQISFYEGQGNIGLGFELLPDPLDGGTFRYRFAQNSTATILQVNQYGQVTVNYDTINTRVINLASLGAIAAGVDIYANSGTGEGTLSLNTGTGVPKIIAIVDPVTQEGVLQFYTGLSQSPQVGTHITGYNVDTKNVVASSLEATKDITLHCPTEFSTVGVLTIDISGNLNVNGQPVGSGGNFGSTFSTMAVSSYGYITTVSAQAIYTSSINGTQSPALRNGKFYLTGGSGVSPIWQTADLTDLTSYNKPSTNGYFNNTGYQIAFNEQTYINMAVGRDISNRCSTIQYMSTGTNKWTYITGGHPFNNTARTVIHADGKWLIGGTPSSIASGVPIIWSSDGTETNFDMSINLQTFPTSIRREVRSIANKGKTFVAALARSSIIAPVKDTLLYTTNLKNWNSVTAGGFENGAYSVGASENLFVAGGEGSDPDYINIAYSPGGKSWTMSSINFMNRVNTVAFAAGTWVAGGTSVDGGKASSLAWSKDGKRWNHAGGVTATEVYSVRYFNEYWYAATTNDNYPEINNSILQSEDGFSWSNMLPSTFYPNSSRDIGFSYQLLFDQPPMVTFAKSTIVRMYATSISTAFISTAQITRLIAPVIYTVQTITYTP